MSEQSRHDRPRLRQFRVTLTEHNERPSLSVSLAWRTFPCSAMHWDGTVYADVPWDGGAITSQQALREALLGAAMEEWHTSPVRRA